MSSPMSVFKRLSAGPQSPPQQSDFVRMRDSLIVIGSKIEASGYGRADARDLRRLVSAVYRLAEEGLGLKIPATEVERVARMTVEEFMKEFSAK